MRRGVYEEVKDEKLISRINKLASELKVKELPKLFVFNKWEGINAGTFAIDGKANIIFTPQFFELSEEKQNAIIAHELMHIKNKDIVIKILADVLLYGGFFAIYWKWKFGMAHTFKNMVEPVVVTIIMALAWGAINYRKEYLADLGAKILGYEEALISLFKELTNKIVQGNTKDLYKKVQELYGNTSHPATIDRLMYLRGLIEPNLFVPIWTITKRIKQAMELGILEKNESSNGN
jgi:Zn-dependent protease with chaperone function